MGGGHSVTKFALAGRLGLGTAVLGVRNVIETGEIVAYAFYATVLSCPVGQPATALGR
jgi:hypothetical protein